MCDNFTECLADNLHFCAPEIYLQRFSNKNKFSVDDWNRANIFSIGMILLYVLLSSDFSIDMNKVYEHLHG